MKIEVMDLVKACHGSMRKVIQLDDLIENLFFYKIIEREEYDKMVDEFLEDVEKCYGEKFVENFFDICNSPNYMENL